MGYYLLSSASKIGMVIGMLVSTIGTASEYNPMPVFPKVDLENATVGGISAGAYFAAQFHVAWSSKLNGVGVIAGGPWGCANGSLTVSLGRCSEGPVTKSDIDELVLRARQKASTGAIEAINNMADDKIFLISGTKDITTRPSVMNSVQPFYEELGVPTENIMYVNDIKLGNAMPTLDYGNECKVDTEPPWISSCNYDAAGEMLKHFYATNEEPLNPRVETSSLTGDFIEYDQAEFTGSVSPATISLNEKGVLYVPKACQEDGEAETCKLHVFFHGCEQVYNSVPSDISGDDSLYDHPPYEIFGDKLWKNAGLNEWADSNNIVIMYPQWRKTIVPFNPKGCSDWWGYTTKNYDEKNGPQMLAIQNMMEKISADKLDETAGQIAAREAGEAAQLATQVESFIITLTEEITELANEASLANNIEDFRTLYGSAKDKLTEAESYFANLQKSAQTSREKADYAENISSGSEASAEAESYAQAAKQSEANAQTAIANAISSVIKSRDTSLEAFSSNLKNEAQEAAQKAADAKQRVEDALITITNTTDSEVAVDSQKEASLAAQESAKYAIQAQAAADLAQSIADEAVGTAVEAITSSNANSASSSANYASEVADEAEEIFFDAKDAAIAVAEAEIQSALDAIDEAETEKIISTDAQSLKIAEEHLAAAHAQLETAQNNLALANAIDMSFDPEVELNVEPVEVEIEKKSSGSGGGGSTTPLLLLLLLLGQLSRRKTK